MDEEDETSQYRSPERKRPTLGRFVLSGLIAVGIVVGLLRITKVSPAEILHTLRGVSLAAILIGLLLHIFAYWLRALRFKLLITSKKVGLKDLFTIMTIHNFMNHALPFRAGELTYVYLINQTQRVPLGEGLGTLAIVRLMELTAFCVYCPLSILWLHFSGFHFPHQYDEYIWLALWCMVPVLLLLTAFLFLIAWKGTAMVNLLRRWIVRGRMRRVGLIHFVFDKMEEVALSFQHLGSKRVYFSTLFISLGLLGVVYLIAYVVLAGIGYRMAYPLVIICSTIASFLFILPLYGLGGFGTVETGWTLGCLMAGFSKGMAVASGFSFHIIVLGYVSLLAIYGVVCLRGFSPAAKPHVGRVEYLEGRDPNTR